MDLLGGASFQRLESAINAASMRQRVLANNIANVDTPHYKRSDVAFEEMLTQAIGNQDGLQGTLPGRVTNAKHIPINGSSSAAVPKPLVVTEDSTSINNNRNNVDIDKEMSLMAENQLRYNLFVQQVNHEVKMMRTGIEGRA
ncbi:flagellar basal body rod protein FlgB [Cohnella sp. GCM10027633]|uniref:flagellar basal body rod protein FlgB n=1 Tax=unclassified Cohnella TaxID=2636738 RepID=UPI00362A7AE1